MGEMAGSWVALLLVVASMVLAAFARYSKFAHGGQQCQQKQAHDGATEQQQQQQQQEEPMALGAGDEHSPQQEFRPAPAGPSPSEHASTTDMLADLLQQFFESSANIAQWVADGGLVTLRSICQSVCGSSPLHDPELQKQAHQISWLLLQVAHAPHATRCKLQDHVPMQLLAKFMSCVLASPALPRKMQAAIQRNCCWALSSLCDVSGILRNSKQASPSAAAAGADAAQKPPSPPQPEDQPASSSAQLPGVGPGALTRRREQQEAPAALGLSYSRSLVDSGVLHILGALLREDFCVDTTSFATSLLASLALLEHVDAPLAAAAQRLLLEPGNSLLLCTLLASQRHGDAVSTLHQYLTHMLRSHAHELTWQLLYDRAVQELLQAVPGQLGLLVAYQLLSQPGQETMVAFEAQYCVDVAVALAHLITSEQANKLVRVPVPEGEDSQGSDAGPSARTYSLRAMASRMLLGGERLEELITACFDELAEAQSSRPGGSPQHAVPPPGQPDAAAPCLQPWVTDTVCAATQLLAHLDSLNMQLSQYRALHGLGVEDLSSIASSVERASAHFEPRASGGPSSRPSGGPSGGLLFAAAPHHQRLMDGASERSLSTKPFTTPLDTVSEHQLEQARQGEEAAPAPSPPAKAAPTDIPSSGDGAHGSPDGGGAQGAASEDACDNWDDNDQVGEDLAMQRSQTVTIQNSSLTASTASIICVSRAEQWGKRGGDEFRPRAPGADDAEKALAQGAWRALQGGPLQPDVMMQPGPTSASASALSSCRSASARSLADEDGDAAAAAGDLMLAAEGALAVQASAPSRTPGVEEHKAAFRYRSASARTLATGVEKLAAAASFSAPSSWVLPPTQGPNPPKPTHPAGYQGPSPSGAPGMTASGHNPDLFDSGRAPEPPQAEPAGMPATGDRGQVLVLSYGRHSVMMSTAQFNGVRRLSGLLHAWLSRCPRTQLHSVLQVPGFSDQENCVVVRALMATGAQQAGEAGGAGAGAGGPTIRVSAEAVDASQAGLVWQAADYYQVDFLKDHCEDLLMRAISRSLEPEAAAKVRQHGSGGGPAAAAAAAAAVAAAAAAAGEPQDSPCSQDALYELLSMEPPAGAPATPQLESLRCRDEVMMQVVQESGGSGPLERGGGGRPGRQIDGPPATGTGAAAAAAPANASSLSKGLADILDLMTRYHHSSGRLQHLLAVLLMRHMQQLVTDRGLAELLSRHKEELMPGLVSLMRDRLVSIVMLSDTLDEET